MVRVLTANTQAKLAQNLGTEPIILIKVDWEGTVGTQYYSDKEYVLDAITTQKRLVSFGTINTQEKDTGIGTISSVSVVLDDLDNVLKDIIESVVPQGKIVTVYHHFEGLDEVDLVPIVKGRLSSPIVWNETNRTLSFDIVSEIEAETVGYAPDENDIPEICEAAKSKPWPLVFGQVRHLPTIRAICSARGHLKTKATDSELPFYVDGGRNFPQSTLIEITIGGCIYEGSFSGELFTPTVSNKPLYTNISLEDRSLHSSDEDYDNARVFWIDNKTDILVGTYCYIEGFPTPLDPISRVNFCYKQEGKKCYFERTWVDAYENDILLPSAFAPLADNIAEVCVNRRLEWGTDQRWRSGATLFSQFSGLVGMTNIVYVWSYRPGSLVLQRGVSDVYIANLEPGSTILEVRGKKTVPGQNDPQLIPIPEDWYTVDANYVIGSKTVTAIIIPIPLEERQNQGWTGDVYVTIESTLSSNTSDVIKHLIENYTSLEADTTSFDAVKTLITNYPSHFALTKTGDALKIIQEIAWQARLGVRIEAGIVTLKYLSKDPGSADYTIDESKIELQSIELGFTEIEDVYTYITAKWREDYSGNTEKTTIYKNNVDVYGMRELEVDFYIYYAESLVLKSLEFWGRRWSNIWRRVKLKSFLTTLSLELFDNLGFALTDTDLIPPTNVLGVMDSINHDPNDNGIILECTLESKAGTKIVSSDFWEDDSGDTPPDPPGTGVTPETEDNQALTTNSSSVAKAQPDATGEEEDEESGGIANLNVGETEPTDVTDDTNTVSLRDILRIIDVAGSPKLALNLDNLYVYSTASNLYAQLTELFDLATVDSLTSLFLNPQTTKFRLNDEYAVLYDILTIRSSKISIKTTAQFTDGSNDGEFDFRWYNGYFYSRLGWFA